jgi:radical SAM superfamily enzyme YgiQ (UPF0313 family)
MSERQKILFLNPPLSPAQRYGALSAAGALEPPLGLAYLAAIARQTGWDTQIMDAQASGLGIDQVVPLILAYEPCQLAITISTMSLPASVRLASLVKAADPSVRIIVGGSHVSACPEATLRENLCFDVGIVGEGERTLAELLLAAQKQGGLSVIDGIVYRQGENIVRTAPRARIDDLDQLPMPAFDLLPDMPRHYRPAAQSLRSLPAVSLVTSRGCPGRCLFCDRKTFGNKVRMHGAAYIADMMERLIKDFGIKGFFFEDDNFMLSEERLVSFAAALRKRRIKTSWSALSRIDTISAEKLRVAKSCGCWQVLFGIESGSQVILDLYRKGITIGQVRKAVALTKRQGLHAKGFFMLGNPLESHATLRETRELIMSLPLDDISIAYFTPYPGSEVWEMAGAYGEFNKDWDKFTCFDPVFVPHGLTREVLSGFQKEVYAAFYSRADVIMSYVSRLRSWAQAFELVKSYCSFKAHVGGARYLG